MITLEEAKRNQANLQATAQKILDHYHVEELLKPLGEIHRVGSFRYGLMAKPDIDFLIYNSNPTLESLVNIASKIMLMDGVGKVSIHNQYIWPKDVNVPKSLYIGFKPIWQNVLWQIDAHVMKPEDQLDAENFYVGWDSKLTESQKDTIIFLKANLIEQGRYPNGFYSVMIYKAVLQGNVKTIEELENWKKKYLSN
jgi:hypothetical protein